MDLNARSIGFSSSCPHAIPRDQLGELAHNIDQKAHEIPLAQRTLLHIGNGIPLGATKERLFHVGQITQLSGGDGKSMRKRKGGPSREEFRPLNQSSPKPQYTMSTIDGLVAINAMYQSAFGNLLQHFSPLLASQTASDESIHQMKRMASNLNEAGVSSLDETNDNQRDRQGLHSSDSPDHFSPFSVDDVDTMSGSSSVALKGSSSSSFHSSDPKIHQQLTPSDCGRHSSSSIHLNSAGQGEQLTPSSQDETRESSSFIYPSSIRQGEQVLQSPQNNAIEALKDRIMELERQADSQNKKLEEKEAQFKAANESNVKLKKEADTQKKKLEEKLELKELQLREANQSNVTLQKEADSLKKKLEDKEELLLAANSENIRLQEEVRAAREGSRMVDDMEDAQDEDQSTRSSGIAVEEEGILDAPEFVRQFSFPVTIICYYDIVDSLNAQQAALNETFHANNEDDQVPNNDNEREKVSQNSSGNEDESSNSTGDKGQSDVSERKTIENSQQLKRSGRLAQKNRAENGNVYEEETDNANSHQTEKSRLFAKKNRFSKKNSIKNNEHHGKKPYRCQECTSSFEHPSQLLSHSFTHKNERNYECHLCDAKYKWPADWRKRLRSVHGDTSQFKCKTCGMAFNKHRDALHHRKEVHPNKCEKCDRSFERKGDLVKHFRIHTGEKPYACDRCEQKFSHNCHRLEHMRKHHHDHN